MYPTLSLLARSLLFFPLSLLHHTSPPIPGPFSYPPELSITACRYTLGDTPTVSIEWGISGCGQNTFPYENAVDIYLNSVSEKAFSYDPGIFPTGPTLSLQRIQELSSFKTVHSLHPSVRSASSYTSHLFAFALDPSTNQSVSLSRFEVPNLLNDFTVSTTDAAEQLGYHTVDGIKGMKAESTALVFEIKPSNWARTANRFIAATNWTLTLVSAYTAIVATRNHRVSFALVHLHFSVALAIPCLRSLRINLTPLSENTDHAGFLSQLIIVTVFSAVLVYNLPFPIRMCTNSQEKI